MFGDPFWSSLKYPLRFRFRGSGSPPKEKVKVVRSFSSLFCALLTYANPGRQPQLMDSPSKPKSSAAVLRSPMKKALPTSAHTAGDKVREFLTFEEIHESFL